MLPSLNNRYQAWTQHHAQLCDRDEEESFLSPEQCKLCDCAHAGPPAGAQLTEPSSCPLLPEIDLTVRIGRTAASSSVNCSGGAMGNLSQLLHLSTGSSGRPLTLTRAESLTSRPQRSADLAHSNSCDLGPRYSGPLSGSMVTPTIHQSQSSSELSGYLMSPSNTASPRTSSSLIGSLTQSPSAVCSPGSRRSSNRAASGSPVGSLQHMMQLLQLSTNGRDLREIRAELQARRRGTTRSSQHEGSYSPRG